jgi:hypothetical protein
MCAGRNPLVVGLERNAELAIEHPQVAIRAADDRIRHDRPNFLSDDANIGFVAAVIAEAVEADAVIEAAEQLDVMLERDVGPPSAATEAAAHPTTADAHATAAPHPSKAPSTDASAADANAYTVATVATSKLARTFFGVRGLVAPTMNSASLSPIKTSRMLSPLVVGDEHYAVARHVSALIPSKAQPRP